MLSENSKIRFRTNIETKLKLEKRISEYESELCQMKKSTSYVSKEAQHIYENAIKDLYKEKTEAERVIQECKQSNSEREKQQAKPI